MSSSQRQVENMKQNQLVCRAQKKQTVEEDDDDGTLVSRRLALPPLIGAATVGSKFLLLMEPMVNLQMFLVSQKRSTGFLSYNRDGFKLSIPSKWNPSKEVENPGQSSDTRTTSTRPAMFTATKKNSISDYGSPEEFLS